jgi:hypothetical protein
MLPLPASVCLGLPHTLPGRPPVSVERLPHHHPKRQRDDFSLLPLLCREPLGSRSQRTKMDGGVRTSPSMHHPRAALSRCPARSSPAPRSRWGRPPVCPAPGTGDTRDERPSHAPRTRTRSPPRSPRRVGLPSGRCAAAFFRISRSSPRIRTARRRRGSSCSSLVSPSLRLPSSRSACLSHRRNVSPVMPRSSAIWRCGLPLPRASRIASARNASGAGCTGRDALTLDTSSDLLRALAPTLPVSTKAGQLQPAHPPGNQTSGDRLPLDRHRRFLRWEFTI